jgi:5-methylcytosine-specific restriction protein A
VKEFADMAKIAKERNPTWTREELILALELYVRFGGNPPGKTSGEVNEVSATLGKLGRRLGVTSDDKFRNANGVYMKAMNFRRLDPLYKERGAAGLSRGGKLEEVIWLEFAERPEALAAASAQILAALETDADLEAIEPEIEDAAEGRLLTRLHRYRERNRDIVTKRKAQAIKEEGELRCEACGFSYVDRYGERGSSFIECHHVIPVSEMAPEAKTMASDLALVCANCHRMIHAKRPWLTIEELKAIIISR